MTRAAGGRTGLAPPASRPEQDATPIEGKEDAPLLDAGEHAPFTFMHQLYRDQVDLLLDGDD
jgi:hypothetical protein